MKVFLMYPDQDFDLQQPLPLHAPALMQDLELNTLLHSMARNDHFLFEVAQKALLTGFQNDVDVIRYRQAILQDCLHNPDIVREIYQLSVESLENKRRRWLGVFTHSPGSILYSSLQLMQMFVELLKRLKQMADDHAAQFTSAGFTTFFAMIRRELDDAYFAEVQAHLKALQFTKGVLLSASLGPGNEGVDYVLRRPHDKGDWVKRVFGPRAPVYTFYIADRDDHGARVINDIREQGINLAANALGQSADHVDNFFKMLRIEMAFYIGCLNLHKQLVAWDAPTTFPQVVPLEEGRHTFTELYDICLALTLQRRIVGNAADASQKSLVMITGANQGGKSTFLRSVGLAQLMTQCGMFAPAAALCAPLCRGLFTHYRRKEDATMKSGKLDEELTRMSEIADQVTPGCLVLFNESFAATNEREGSEIARQIVSALLERGIRVIFVTHQYELARGFYERNRDTTLFLRAERQADGSRTFKLNVAPPLATSFGEDLYHGIFEGDGQDAMDAAIPQPIVG